MERARPVARHRPAPDRSPRPWHALALALGLALTSACQPGGRGDKTTLAYGLPRATPAGAVARRAPPASIPSAPTKDRERAMYVQRCRPCHGDRLDGGPPVHPALPSAGLDLLGPRVAARRDEDYHAHLRRGTRDAQGRLVAPPLGGVLREDQILDLIAYLRAVQSGALPLPPREEP